MNRLSAKARSVAASSCRPTSLFVRRHSQRLPTVLIPGLLAALALVGCAPPGPNADLVIENVTVYTGEDKAPVVASVAIADGRILALTPPGERGPRAEQAVDGSGQYLVPGLWDAHVHLRSSEEGGLDIAAFFTYGITSLRDLGGYGERLDAALADADGASQTLPAVYPARFMLNGESFAGFQTVVETPADAAEIERLAGDGARFVKVHRALAPDLLPVVVREAHARGLAVTGHIPLGMHPLLACQAGMDGVEHVGSLVEALASVLPDGSNSSRDAQNYLLSDATNRIYECLADNGVYVTPTLVIYPSIARRRAGADEIPPEFAAIIDDLEQITKRLYDSGVPLLAGTDTSDLSENIVLDPGQALLDEFAMLESAGIPAADLVEIASANAARFLGVFDDTGSIAPGKAADFVLLDADPATGSQAFRTVRATYRGGQRVYEAQREASD